MPKLIAILFALLAATACGQEFTDQEIASAERDKERRIAMLEEEAAEVEKKKSEAVKQKDFASSKVLIQKLKEIKAEIRTAKRQKVEEYAEEAKATRERLARERRELDEAAKQQEQERAADAARMKVSGNCPLRVDGANFAHLTDVDLIALFHKVDARTTLGLTPLTAVMFEVTNRSGQEVLAWELSYQLLDGFDEVIFEGEYKNPLIKPAESAKIRIGSPHVSQAVQMRIYVHRAKLNDGTVWERKPEHEQVGVIVKKLEGADLMRQAK